MPHYSIYMPAANGTFIQTSALAELQKKTTIGHQIVEMESKYIDSVKDAIIRGEQEAPFMFDMSQNWY